MSPRSHLMVFTCLLGLVMAVTASLAVVEESGRIAVAPLAMTPLFVFFAWALLNSRKK